jgi:membrane associated rhomboid family serine protease
MQENRPPLPKLSLKSLAIDFLVWINLVWGLVNLLPIWPLDGGQISRDSLDWLLPQYGVRVALGVSLVIAGLLAINALLAELDKPLIPYVPTGGLLSILLFGSLAIGSFQALQEENERRSWLDDHFTRSDHDDRYRDR